MWGWIKLAEGFRLDGLDFHLSNGVLLDWAQEERKVLARLTKYGGVLQVQNAMNVQFSLSRNRGLAATKWVIVSPARLASCN